MVRRAVFRDRRKDVFLFAPPPLPVDFDAFAESDIVGDLLVAQFIHPVFAEGLANCIAVGAIIGVARIFVFLKNRRSIIIDTYFRIRHDRAVFQNTVFRLPKHIFRRFFYIPLRCGVTASGKPSRQGKHSRQRHRNTDNP